MKVISYNCRGLPNNASKLHYRPCVMDILNNDDIDIVCLQESWCSKQDLGSLHTLHADFHGTGAATVDYRDHLCRGHSPGGMAILWCTFLGFVNIGIEINFSNRKYVILCVYVPYKYREHEYFFLEYLGTLKVAIEDLYTTCISIVGDWNSDISNQGSVFCRHFKLLSAENDWLLSSELLLPADTFTYFGERWD